MFAFNNKVVRDLAWAIGSPPLFEKGELFFTDEFFINEYKLFLPYLKQLDLNPLPLQEYISSQRSRKLGFYFEHLIRFWLNKCENYDLITSNFAIHTTEKTLGELDFIVKNKISRQNEHWEVAVKFYLGYGNTLKWSGWIGPNKVDTLAGKMYKLKYKQLKLSKKAIVKDKLMEIGVDELIPKVFIKGFFFYHLKKGFPYQTMPYNCYQGHSKAWWLYYDEFLNSADKNAYWYIYDKSEWLSNKIIQDEREMLTYREMIDKLSHLVKSEKKPQMLSKISNYMELGRGFVVPQSWP